MDRIVGLSEEVLRFAIATELELEANEHKEHWSHLMMSDLAGDTVQTILDELGSLLLLEPEEGKELPDSGAGDIIRRLPDVPAFMEPGQPATIRLMTTMRRYRCPQQ